MEASKNSLANDLKKKVELLEKCTSFMGNSLKEEREGLLADYTNTVDDMKTRWTTRNQQQCNYIASLVEINAELLEQKESLETETKKLTEKLKAKDNEYKEETKKIPEMNSRIDEAGVKKKEEDHQTQTKKKEQQIASLKERNVALQEDKKSLEIGKKTLTDSLEAQTDEIMEYKKGKEAQMNLHTDELEA